MENLTKNEIKAIKIFVANIADEVGFSDEEFFQNVRTEEISIPDYIMLEQLTDEGYTRYKAAGTMATLEKKGWLFDSAPEMRNMKQSNPRWTAHWVICINLDNIDVLESLY